MLSQLKNSASGSVLLNVSSLSSLQTQDSAIDADYDNYSTINNFDVHPKLENYLKDSDIHFKQRPTVEVLHQPSVDPNNEVRNF